jgi:O-antigen/teichoic acid export membrane protein
MSTAPEEAMPTVSAAPPPTTPADPAPSGSAGRVVTRNVMHLLMAQVASMVIAFIVTVRIARHLGPEDYGILFFATSFVALAFTLVDLGQSYYLVQAVARDHSRAGLLFGTGFVLRAATAAAIFLPVWGLSFALGYPPLTRAAILATFLFSLAQSLGSTSNLTFRGLERMDRDALQQTVTKVLYGVTSLAAVWLGMGVVGIILGQAAGTALGATICVVSLLRLGIPRPRFDRAIARELLHEGAPYLTWASIVAIHGTMDSILLSKLATPASIGWYGASTRLTQILTLPASILATALFPTLSRLHGQGQGGFAGMTRASLKWMLYVGACAGAGAIVFGTQAVALVYGGRAFGPAADILRVSSLFVICLFLNFVLGTAVMAAGRQRPWIWVKAIVVLVLVGLNVTLIPRAQERFGNGGIGAAAAAATAEVILVAAAIVLLPAGTLDWGFLQEVGRVLVGFAGMAAVKLLLGGTTIFVGAPLAVLVYVGAIVALGGVRRAEVADLKAAFLPGRAA